MISSWRIKSPRPRFAETSLLVAGECCGEDAARRIKGIGADSQHDAWIRRFLVQPNATTDTSGYPLISSSEVFFSSERSSNSRRDSATSTETTWFCWIPAGGADSRNASLRRDIQQTWDPEASSSDSSKSVQWLQKRAAMLHRNDIKYWLRGSGKYAFLWHMKSEEMKAVTQEQTFKKYVNDVKTDSKRSQQRTADTIMSEASAAATKEAIEAIVALALKRDTGTAGKMTCIAGLPRAVMSPVSAMNSTASNPLTITMPTTAIQIPVYDGKNFVVWVETTALDDDVSLKLMTAKQLQPDNIAKGVIIGHANNPVTMFERAYDMFAYLKERYTAKGADRQAELVAKLYSTKMLNSDWQVMTTCFGLPPGAATLPAADRLKELAHVQAGLRSSMLLALAGFKDQSKQLGKEVIATAMNFQLSQLDQSIPYYQALLSKFTDLSVQFFKGSVNSLYARSGSGSGVSATTPDQFTQDVKSDAKRATQQTADTIMGDAESATTQEIIKSLVAKSLKDKIGAASNRAPAKPQTYCERESNLAQHGQSVKADNRCQKT
ncbi:hypothetical protein V1504DRAFT_471174 [Lipomyces starkeyi]